MHIFACELHVSPLKSPNFHPNTIPGPLAGRHSHGYGPRTICPG